MQLTEMYRQHFENSTKVSNLIKKSFQSFAGIGYFRLFFLFLMENTTSRKMV